MKTLLGLGSVFLVLLAASIRLAAQDGASLYQRRCAKCHDANSGERIPTRAALQQMSPDAILKALESGVMREQAAGLKPQQRRAIAAYLTGKSVTRKKVGAIAVNAPHSGFCSATPTFSPGQQPQWNGWGADPTNHRFQPESAAGLRAADVPRLKLKWAFAFPETTEAYGQPIVVGGRLFVGGQQGTVTAMDANSGCIHWSFKARATVRTSVVVASFPEKVVTIGGPEKPGRTAALSLAFFADHAANVYAVDAATGELRWATKLDTHPSARITGSPQFHEGRLYVPVSSFEELLAADPHYECCRFRGSVVALDALSGRQLWKTHTVPEVPHPTAKKPDGTQLYGPSGVGVWMAPTLDVEHNLLYIGTGDSYSEPAAPHSDSILALNMASGEVVWARQLTADDIYNASCGASDEPSRANCPEHGGPDFDFGAPPILVTLPNGRRALIAGQKSGMVHALDPDQKGKILWQVRVAEGGLLGGVEWGMAADENNVYVPVSDMAWGPPRRVVINGKESKQRILDPKKGGGLWALRLATGEKVWHVLPAESACANRERCGPAQPAPVTVIPGVVFSGSLDGHLRAHSAEDGRVLWEFDTARSFSTVNGVTAHGGSIDAAGPVVAGGTLYINSGYGKWGGTPGNALLAFTIDGK